MDETKTPMDLLRDRLAAVRDNARYAADPRQPCTDMADAWCAYFDATVTDGPATEPVEG